jgi:hypothetical protein
MAGFGDDSAGQDVVFADNVDFSGAVVPQGQVLLNGQLLIGSTALPHIRVGMLMTPNNTLSIGYSSPNITLDVQPGAVTQHLTGNTGGLLNPDINNNFNILGAAVGAGSTPVTTVGLSHTITIDVQTAQAIASTDATKIGLAAFNSTQFTVDAFGFVQLAGGTTAAIEKVNLQTGTTSIVPTSGAITFNGAVVAAGTNPVRTDGTGANTMALEVQKSQALASADATKIGLSNFSSAQFAVDANGFVQLAGGTTSAIKSVTRQVFTTTGTYTPTTNMVYCDIEVVGGGGGGGGVAGSINATGGGGAGGGYAKGIFSAATIGASKSVTIGAAGTAGANTGGDGGTGGTTSVDALISATGGLGGGGATVNAVQAGRAGGSGTNGDFQTTGAPGGIGYILVGNGAIGGIGGSSFFGGGANVASAGAGSGIGGNNAVSYGGGGGGALVTAGVSGQAGGAGFKGLVIITEYIT